MYTESPPLAGRASSERPLRPGPHTAYRSSGFKKAPFASNRPSTIRQISRALGRFSVVLLIGVGATLAWQSYGGEMVRAWAPSLGWLFPASPFAELQAQLKPVALDLAITRRSVEQLASNQDQLARKQDQMTQAFATLQAAVRDINQNILALAPLAPKAAHVPPPKPLQPAAQ
jgi:hypothetical protein